MPFSIDLDAKMPADLDGRRARIACGRRRNSRWLTRACRRARTAGRKAASAVPGSSSAGRTTNGQRAAARSGQRAGQGSTVSRNRHARSCRVDSCADALHSDAPDALRHYGGYYTMTDENWPLIGPMGTDGAYIVGALSGFGSMSACAAGQSMCRVGMWRRSAGLRRCT